MAHSLDAHVKVGPLLEGGRELIRWMYGKGWRLGSLKLEDALAYSSLYFSFSF
jgi:hypothetical protein